ncbi:hypothetical protein CK203_006587 [Vitis vinifera]|uniref:DUF4283 domain-containing protein n=1 Tax=Vitis vinifera TaxID=29760 RepID=A0A438KAV5_VITVI|nr:hypothetical protein CK203_006587 [Vitis vinifera]
MAEKLKQVLGFFGKKPEKQKGKAVEKVVMGGSYATMVRKPWTGNSNVVAVKVKKEESEGLIKKLKHCVVASWRDGSGGEDDIEKWGKFWAKSWDLKGNLGLAKLNKRKALLEFENLDEARRVVSSGSCAWEGTQVREEESYDVSLRWECWPVLRRKCRDEVDRHSREVRGEEDSHAGQHVKKDWGSGRLETLHPSDEGTVVQGVGSGRVEISPDLSPTTRTWVSSGEMKPLSPIAGPKETRRDGGPSLMFGSMDLKKKGVAASDVGPDAGPSYGREDVGCYTKGPTPPIAQLSNKGLFVQSYPPEAEIFVARETEDTRKLQGVVRLTETDRALEEESMRYGMGSGRPDNSMWLTVYKACNERIKECKELGVIKCNSDKGREMEGVGDIDDAQVERSELEGNWEESGLARFSQFLGFPTEGLEKEILNFLTKIRKRREKIHSKELLEKSKFERELKRLECSINYEGGMKQKGSVQGKGRQIETKLQCMTDSIARSIGSGRFLGWKAVNAEELRERAVGGSLVHRGDFNITLFSRERSSQRRISSAMRKFAETVDDLGLVDLPLQGGDFTWNGGLHNQTWARLDRFLVSPSWIDQFSGINQCRLPRPVSDHFPIMLVGGGIRRGPTPFRFENMWLKAEGFKELVRSWWQGIDVRGSASYKLATKMKEIKQKLKVWNREVFGKLESNKSAALQQVEFWDREENERILTMEESKLKKETKENYKKWVIMEETHWRQLSREIWLKEGDRNTGFFHRMASAHRRNNCMERIKINGEWLLEEQEIREGIANAFKELLSEDTGWKADIGSLQLDQISQEEAEILERPFTEDEIHGL